MKLMSVRPRRFGARKIDGGSRETLFWGGELGAIPGRAREPEFGAKKKFWFIPLAERKGHIMTGLFKCVNFSWDVRLGG